MIDINLIREKPELVKKNIVKKFQNPKIVDQVKKKDEEWRKLKAKVDELRASRNMLSLEINKAKKSGKDDPDLIRKAREIPAMEMFQDSIFLLILICMS